MCSSMRYYSYIDKLQTPSISYNADNDCFFFLWIKTITSKTMDSFFFFGMHLPVPTTRSPINRQQVVDQMKWIVNCWWIRVVYSNFVALGILEFCLVVWLLGFKRVEGRLALVNYDIANCSYSFGFKYKTRYSFLESLFITY